MMTNRLPRRTELGPHRHCGSTRKPFTLIELLTCVAVIAILVALLLPVLGRAKYKAQLVVCLNNQRQTAMGVLQYASDYNGRYPHRYTNDRYDTRADQLSRAGFDDRPVLKGYLDDYNELLNDPLVPSTIDLTAEVGNQMVANYQMYWGLKYQGESKGMIRVGQPLVYRGKEYRTLLGDRCMYINWGTRTSHPDGSMQDIIRDTDAQKVNGFGNPLMEFRDELDLVFTQDDGSARIYWGVGMGDPQMARIGAFRDRNLFWPRLYSEVPAPE